MIENPLTFDMTEQIKRLEESATAHRIFTGHRVVCQIRGELDLHIQCLDCG